MSVHEPMTLITDYAMGIAAVLFAARLWRVHRMWALAFACTAAASFFGGTYHGFEHVLAPLAAFMFWKATVFAVGFASFFLLAGSGRALAVFGIVKLVVYISWMIMHDDFFWVIADYGITLLVVGAVQLIRREPSMKWVLASIAVSVIGALIQQSGFTLHRHFNYNDLYHVVQTFALWLLYRGGLLMRRSAALPDTERVRESALPS